MAIITRHHVAGPVRTLSRLRRAVDALALILLEDGIVVTELMSDGKLVLQFFHATDRDIELGEWREGEGVKFFSLVSDGVQDHLMHAYSHAYSALMVRK